MRNRIDSGGNPGCDLARRPGVGTGSGEDFVQATKRGGFSLVEVCLAILVIALGMTVIFGLFPLGLKAVEDATEETRSALFAECLFAEMRAYAAGVTNWNMWVNTNQGGAMSYLVPTSGFVSGSTIFTQQYPTVAGQASTNYVRYRLTLGLTNVLAETNASIARFWGVLLEVRSGQRGAKWGSFTNPVLFYTEIPYGGQ